LVPLARCDEDADVGRGVEEFMPGDRLAAGVDDVDVDVDDEDEDEEDAEAKTGSDAARRSQNCIDEFLEMPTSSPLRLD
jgi:hypothetical protein